MNPLPLGGLDHPRPGARRVEIVRVEFAFIIDHTNHLLECKVAHVTGERTSVDEVIGLRCDLSVGRAPDVGIVPQLLASILEEYCEPF